MDDFESCINAIDNNYDSGDVIFTRWLYKLNTPQLKVVKRSAYAKGAKNMKKLLNITDKTVIFQQSGHCFQKMC